MNSVGVSRDDDKFEFLTEFWVETHAYWIYSDYLAGFDPNLTSFTLVWPLFRLIGPQRILNLNSGQNSESKHMYVGYIATNLPDLTLIWRFWPTFDLIWPQKVMIHTSPESQCNFRSFKVYSINIRPLGVAEKPFLDFFSPWSTFFNHELPRGNIFNRGWNYIF